MKTMLKRTATLAATGLMMLSLPALAEGLETDPAKVQAGTYSVETSHTRVLFAVNHMGFTTWYGDLPGATGTLTLDPANPAASSLKVTIPTDQVLTTNAKVDGELKDPDWFDSKAFPEITFVSTEVKTTGANTADVTGDLTFHGVTKPVTLAVTFNGAGENPLNKAYTVGFEATGALKRSDFGVAKYVPMVGDDVKLMISAGFEKQ